MEASFEDFVRSRGPALLRYAHLLCGDGARAEDLVQDALVKVHRRWAGGAEVSAPSAYCADSRDVVASLTLTITGADVSTTTSTPSLMSTVTYTVGATVTSTTVVALSPGSDGAATETVTVSR